MQISQGKRHILWMLGRTEWQRQRLLENSFGSHSISFINNVVTSKHSAVKSIWWCGGIHSQNRGHAWNLICTQWPFVIANRQRIIKRGDFWSPLHPFPTRWPINAAFCSYPLNAFTIFAATASEAGGHNLHPPQFYERDIHRQVH